MGKFDFNYIADEREPAEQVRDLIEHHCSRKLWLSLIEANHPTVVEIKQRVRPTMQYGNPAQEHRVEMRLTAVQTRDVTWIKNIDPPVVKHIPPPTIGQRLKSWWHEMTSEVVYDGGYQ